MCFTRASCWHRGRRFILPGQTGKGIFSDDFSDNSGGWDVDSHETYVPGALQVAADPKEQGDGSQNLTFNATEGDYCVDIAFPSTAPEADNLDYASLMFLGSDTKNRYQLNVNTAGEAWIGRLVDNVWQELMPHTKIDVIKTAPGADNVLRVVVKDQRLTFYVNGTQIQFCAHRFWTTPIALVSLPEPIINCPRAPEFTRSSRSI